MSTTATGFTTQLLRVDELSVEPDCQRDLNIKRARAMADSWDPFIAGALHVAKVVEPDGTIKHFVLDGWTRRNGASLAGVEEVACHVAEGMDKAARAEAFLRLNVTAIKPGRLDFHRVAVTAGRTDACDIETVLAAHGLKVGGSPSANTVAAIGGCYKLHALGGAPLLGDTISVLKSAWSVYGGDAYQVDLLVGTGRVLNANPDIDRDRLVKTLTSRTPRHWLAEVAQRSKGSGGSGGRPLHAARAIVEAYNAGLRSERKRIAA